MRAWYDVDCPADDSLASTLPLFSGCYGCASLSCSASTTFGIYPTDDKYFCVPDACCIPVEHEDSEDDWVEYYAFGSPGVKTKKGMKRKGYKSKPEAV
jgi:hypothetical protein